MSKKLLLIIGMITLLILFVWQIQHRITAPQKITDQVVLAVPMQPMSASLFIANENLLFQKHGISSTNHPFALSKDALAAVLNDKADLAIVADTPFMFSVLDGNKLSILATIFSSRQTLAIVTRKDRGIKKYEDLINKTIGTQIGENSQFYLDLMLVTHNIPEQKVRIVDVKPESIIEALESGKIDAVTAWHPLIDDLQKVLGNKAGVIHDEEIFSFRFNLVAKVDYIKSHPETIKKILFALDDANQFIYDQPKEANKIVAKYLHLDPLAVGNYLKPSDFTLKLDQNLLLLLDDQTRWAIKRGLTKVEQVPNYLNYINLELLGGIMPQVVRIIR